MQVNTHDASWARVDPFVHAPGKSEPFVGATMPATRQSFGEHVILPIDTVPFVQTGCVPDKVYPSLHASAQLPPFFSTEPFPHSAPITPFAGADTPLIESQSLLTSAVHWTLPASNVPAEQLGCTPDIAKFGKHVSEHELPWANTLPGVQSAGKLAPLEGFVKLDATAHEFATHVTHPASKRPA